MNRIKTLGIVMLLAIIGVVGFQAYWLKKTFEREQLALQLKSNSLFRETVRTLQDSALSSRLIHYMGTNNEWSSVKETLSKDTTQQIRANRLLNFLNREGKKFNRGERERIVSTFLNPSNRKWNRDQHLSDSLEMPPNHTEFEALEMNLELQHAKTINLTLDSLFNGLLSDSIISTTYKKALLKEDIPVQFSFTKNDLGKRNHFSPHFPGRPDSFPYKLELKNTWGYLLNQMLLPILFSLFLVVLTVGAFVLLYKNMLRQKRLADTKNEFISNITHELKTPIATVGVAIEALKNFSAIDNPEKTREYLDISQNELQRLNLLVDKVLKLSVFEHTDIELNQQPVDLSKLIDEVLQSMQLQFEKYRTKVEFTQTGSTIVNADKVHLLSVIFNLVDNALKYGKSGNEVSIALNGDKPGTIELKISDKGIGIPKEYQNKIFDKFFRVPHGDTHNAKGHGLGLSYVAQVINKHNGTISVQSQTGKGTSFVINLPK